MRITLALQDQDGVLDSVDRAVADYLGGLPREDRDEDGLADAVRRRIEIELARWIENDAFITVEVDLDRREARVVPVGESGLAEAPRPRCDHFHPGAPSAASMPTTRLSRTSTNAAATTAPATAGRRARKGTPTPASLQIRKEANHEHRSRMD